MRVTDDGSRTLMAPGYGESYHSQRGALSEARHVFLDGAGVARRLADGLATSVLEVGFGAGLNTLVTLDAARAGTAPLTYVTLERELLPAATLHALDYRALFPDPAPADALLAWLATLPAGAPGRHATELAGARLELLVGDARSAPLPSAVHAVYHDAFSPDVNPELWDEPFLAALYAALAPGGRLATYTVKGAVRRRLSAIGFEVRKVAGPPGGKREVLVARKPGPERP